MNYSALLKGLLAEIKSKKQYLRLPTAVRVLAFIGMFPFVVMAAMLLVTYVVYGFFFNMLAASVAYLEAWLHGERKGVRHATEAVLYFVAAPTIFLMHCILSSFACAYFIVWFLLQCFVYIATLGGIRFQPYINTASYEKGESDYQMTGSTPALIAVSCVAFGLFALFLIFYIIGLIDGGNNGYYDPYYGYYYSGYSEFTGIANIFDAIYTLFAVIAIPVCAKKTIGAAKVTDATDELPTDDEDADLELPEV